MADVVFALTGDVRRNSRALRQIHLLVEHGLTVDVLTHGLESTSLNLQGVHIHRLTFEHSRGPRFFFENHRRMGQIALSIPAKVYHASDLYVLPALSRAADRHGGALTYDARELYPYVASTAGKPATRLFWLTLERRYIRKTSGVFTVSNGIADKLVELYGITKPHIVHNVPARPPVRSSSRLRLAVGSLPNTSIILHQGQMREHRGCQLLIDAMRDVDNSVLVFLGNGPLRSELQVLAKSLAVNKRVHFLDPVDPSELLAYTASADVGVTLLEDVCLNHRLALPNKLFEYLVAHVPVVASNLPEIKRVVVDQDVGIVVDPTKRSQLIEALRQATSNRGLRDHWRSNIPAVLETYSWERSSAEFMRVFTGFF